MHPPTSVRVLEQARLHIQAKTVILNTYKHTKKLALFQVKRTIYFTNLCLFSHPMVL